ncbi:MAG: fibronectin/fibrinogen-binding protein [Lachnospiraceae bacterium]|nr:fibronectin/fibrinogen-binding protein [Lachnospiraceae bacterium]
MALDGIVTANLRKEIEDCVLGGRISKIAQPEADELLLTIKSQKGQYRLALCASASLPYACFTDTARQNPASAPGFCMLLRKHIGGGRITQVSQPGLERILSLTVEHLDELGDVRHKKLIIEIMGKHSNLIFCDEDDRIIDSIKHIPATVSSLREVLPGRSYFIPNTQNKKDPLTLSFDEFIRETASRPLPCAKALYSTLTGLSPLAAEEVCFRASIDSDATASSLDSSQKQHLYGTLRRMMEEISGGHFFPNMVSKNGIPEEFASIRLTHLTGRSEDPSGEPAPYTQTGYDSISQVLQDFYAARSVRTRIHQKSADLRKVVSTALERNIKKYDLQLRQLKDTEKREKYRIYGELIHTFGYRLPEGARELTAPNYYDGDREIRIPLDPERSAADNAARYFEKYNKQKRTAAALATLTRDTAEEIEHLESIATALCISRSEADLAQIREELQQFGYIKKHAAARRGPGYKGQKKEKRAVSKPLHYLSSDGFHIYVGKNNYQNEEITFRLADGGDWWFHAKGMPGSHVIVKTGGQELTDRTFEEAGRLAAYYSKGQGSEKVEIDYVKRKEVKKTAGGKPGFVIYHTNYSLIAAPDIEGLTEV